MPLARVARGELLSVRAEIRVALYLGVLLVVSGVGLLLKDNVERIGPSAVALAVALAAAACLAWAWRRSAPASWGEAASPHPAFDYVLLLGALLVAADLAWLEAQSRLLGPAWPLHLLVLALFYGALAFRFDSKHAPLALARLVRGLARNLAEPRARVPRDGRRRAPEVRGARDRRALRGRRDPDGPRREEGALRGRLGERGRPSRARGPPVGRFRARRLGGLAPRSPRRSRPRSRPPRTAGNARSRSRRRSSRRTSA